MTPLVESRLAVRIARIIFWRDSFPLWPWLIVRSPSSLSSTVGRASCATLNTEVGLGATSAWALDLSLCLVPHRRHTPWWVKGWRSCALRASATKARKISRKTLCPLEGNLACHCCSSCSGQHASFTRKVHLVTAQPKAAGSSPLL